LFWSISFLFACGTKRAALTEKIAERDLWLWFGLFCIGGGYCCGKNVVQF
jgi:hypothetical protein